MAKKLFSIIGLMVLLTLSGSAFATTIAFDDLPNPNPPGWSAPFTSYMGFNWNGYWGLLADAPGLFVPPPVAFPSGPNGASNGFGLHDSSMSSGSPFYFLNAQMIGWDPNVNIGGAANTITIEGYLGSTLQYSQLFNLSTTSFTTVTGSAMLPVDNVHFITDKPEYAWWVLDNANVGNVDTAPEPSSLILIGTGILGLGFVGRKRMRIAE